MTPHLDLSQVHTACRRPQCSSGSGTLHRHHMGCEHMFVRHFVARAATKRYQEFLARYKEFNREDVVELCDECHFEIHVLYGLTIREASAKLQKPLARFTWLEAERLMNDLREVCRQWLEDPRVFAGKTARAAAALGTVSLPSVPDRRASLRRLLAAGEAHEK